MLYRLLEASALTAAYPVEELNDYLRTNPDSRAAAAETLGYVDPVNHVATIRAATMLPMTADADGPGAVDHDWLDAWLATELEAPARSRFREHV